MGYDELNTDSTIYTESGYPDLTSLQGLTPEEIAEKLFTQGAKNPNTCQFCCDENEMDIITIFEILITILLEGLNILSGGLDKFDYTQFSEHNILSLNPWFHSIGFKIRAYVYSSKDKDYDNNYYCRVMTKSLATKNIFFIKNIQKNYHFFINGSAYKENQNKQNIKDITCIFVNPYNNNTYEISFDTFI